MTDMTARLARLGAKIPELHIPASHIDLALWSVIACDQYTSNSSYWSEVASLVGDNPSALNLIYPEIYLEEERRRERIEKIHHCMEEYLKDGTLRPAPDGLYLVKRKFEGSNKRAGGHRNERHGVLLALDLEQYDFAPGSQSLIRATEDTIVSRIPPRLEVRRNAVLESPHILVLINDPDRTVIEPLAKKISARNPLYATDLMLQGGFLEGHVIANGPETEAFARALEALLPSENGNGFLFAMGDGNHSFATAKAHWDEQKEKLSDAEREDHPARYGLVEVVNLYDPGLVFHSIHRVLFDVNGREVLESMSDVFSDHSFEETDPSQLISLFDDGDEEDSQSILCGIQWGDSAVRISNQRANRENLPAAIVQEFLDAYLNDHPNATLDYIHGAQEASTLAAKNNTCAVFVPVLAKEELFPTVLGRGILPQKAFSLGESDDKRFYFECRRIR